MYCDAVLNGSWISVMDAGVDQDFTFTEGVSSLLNAPHKKRSTTTGPGCHTGLKQNNAAGAKISSVSAGKSRLPQHRKTSKTSGHTKR